MKQVAFALVLFGMVTLAVAQGTVSFVNTGAFPTPADRLVRDPANDCAPLVGTNYVAQLYYGADAASLQAHTAAPSRFRTTMTTSPGTWSGGTRTLIGFGAGQTATMQVRVWDSNFGATWEIAVGHRDVSNIFAYDIPGAGSPPSAFLMDNMRFFCIPEPSLLALGVLGIGSLFLWRRR